MKKMEDHCNVIAIGPFNISITIQKYALLFEGEQYPAMA